jgi:hypothetical protein
LETFVQRPITSRFAIHFKPIVVSRRNRTAIRTFRLSRIRFNRADRIEWISAAFLP